MIYCTYLGGPREQLIEKPCIKALFSLQSFLKTQADEACLTSAQKLWPDIGVEHY